MPQTTVSPDLLQSLQIITKFGIHSVGQDLRVLAIDDILLPVQEPCGDLELCGVLDDSDEALKLIGVEVTSAVWHEN